jgi:hypothetical protein
MKEEAGEPAPNRMAVAMGIPPFAVKEDYTNDEN